MNKYLFLVVYLFFMAHLVAQTPPGSDIYLVELAGDTLQAGSVQNITSYPGYDNQPAFLTDNSGLLYASIRDTSQADIFHFDIESKQTRQLTHTAESEFSPQPRAINPLVFSTVRVEDDGTQRLWQYDAAGKQFKLLLPDVQPVGYHAWLNDDILFLFVLGEPHELVVVDRLKNTQKEIASDIGRCLQKVPDEPAISFVQKSPDKAAKIQRVNMDSYDVVDIAPTLADGEDYAWFDASTLLMGLGAKIYKFAVESDSSWIEFLNLESAGVSSIKRIAVSFDKRFIAFVAEDADVKKN